MKAHIFSHPKALPHPRPPPLGILLCIHVLMNLNKKESFSFHKTLSYTDYLPLSPIFVPNGTFVS